ncbi:MAG: 2-keto-4-pentenoate hydratase [Phenylobacterium sp.]|uniref:2-keto-4-pentenoate hydratase n=1 Tax=Phenylobacterium sp. TaxID=1871053 RepID=UPI001B75F139|nr:2-keto-4-pentenoate hydratase [Phenylobacterium sp.]MBP7814646.1 2-keto-4-pentenoate hydratase [Phenylobacterium sp.]MBP9231322.1 2-keto-4-pentenoate hydratase [Phenylobacterium sp.]MBP9755856.1 2-keto-4-pentenoate hydratase [Phenylobacterium sp.]
MADGFPIDDVAARFVRARRSATALPDYPGPVPSDLATGYRVQDAALKLWPDEVVGWKVGRVPPEHEERLRSNRICGPVFAKSLWHVKPGEVTPFPVFEGGFAAVEAEYVARIAFDAPADKLSWTTEEADALIGALHIGMEPAGSPLASINILGPTVVVSDFGNNAGLMVGAEIADWRSRRIEDLRCETVIAGQVMGQGGAFVLPGGPVESIRFLAENTARRGRPLKAGMYICTGAAAGIHDIVAGQSGAVRFDGDGEIACRAFRAQPGE